MHELSVATSIRDVLEHELAHEGHAIVVDAVRLRVGALSNVVPDALRFAWPHAVADSPLLGGAALEIEWIEASLRCRECSATRTIGRLVSLRCPACRSGEVEVVGGDELDIVAVDVHDRAAPPP